jgi:ATP-dependent Clp protease adaptor protein ClpS
MNKQSGPDAARQTKAYNVVLLNDELTPGIFVVSVLEQFFHLTSDAASEFMLRAHHCGSAVCGTYSLKEATQLVDDVTAFARSHQHPLKCVIEPK